MGPGTAVVHVEGVAAFLGWVLGVGGAGDGIAESAGFAAEVAVAVGVGVGAVGLGHCLFVFVEGV